MSAAPRNAGFLAGCSWVLLLPVLLLTTAVRVRLLDVPLERDEGEYAYAGQLLLEGVPPYRLACNMKLPGTYVAYAAIMALLGQTPRGIHLGLLLVNLATAVLVFLLARRLFDAWTGALAGGAFAIVSLSQGVYGVFAHATHFVILPAVGGALLLLRAAETGGAAAAVSSGLLFGTAFVTKQHGIFFVLFAVAWLAWERPARRLAPCFWLLVGAALPFAAICAWLLAAGVFREFWFWTFDYARAYVSEAPLSLGLRTLALTLPGVVGPTLPLWILAGVGLCAPAWDGAARGRLRFTTAFAIFSAAAICPGWYFREHYFVLLLPAASILAAVGVGAVGRLLREGAATSVPAVLFAAAILYPVVRERDFFFSWSPIRASRATYGPNPFPEAVEIAARIAADSAPDDRVAVLGSEPEIYFYARRRSATGHIYMYGLMENQPYARRMQEEAIREIEASAPRYVVFVNIPTSWLGRPDSDTTILTWSRTYLAENYTVAGVADIQSESTTAYVWGDEALDYQPRSPYVVYVLRRNP